MTRYIVNAAMRFILILLCFRVVESLLSIFCRLLLMLDMTFWKNPETLSTMIRLSSLPISILVGLLITDRLVLLIRPSVRIQILASSGASALICLCLAFVVEDLPSEAISMIIIMTSLLCLIIYYVFACLSEKLRKPVTLADVRC